MIGKPIRDEVIALMKEGKRAEAAAITKGKGAAHVKKIDDIMHFFIDFAKGKADEFMANANKTRDSVVGLVVVIVTTFVLIGSAFAFFIARSVSRPISAMTGVMGELADDNLKVEVPFTDRTNEIGDMAVSVNHFKNQLVRVKQLEGEQEEQKRIADHERHAAMLQLADSFEHGVGDIVQSVMSASTQLQASANQMS